MSWMCPYCGYENYHDPLNSRHKPKCGRCNHDMKTPAELQDQINDERGDYLEIINSEQNRLCRARDEIESLNSDLVHAESAFNESAKIISDAKKELSRLGNMKIFREIDRETKVQSDKKQTKINEMVS